MVWQIRTQGYGAARDIDLSNSRRVHADVGGRVDVKTEVEGFGIVASVTDQGIRHQSLKDVVVTADRSHGNSNFLVGYDLGLKSVFAQVSHVTDIASKHASAGATWFQHQNKFRGEAAVQLSSNAQLWGAHTLNTKGESVGEGAGDGRGPLRGRSAGSGAGGVGEGHLGTPTLTTLKERNGFLIAPFTVPIAASAAALNFERDGYTISPAYDFNKRAAYLSVGATRNNKRIKASYAFQEEYALLEVSNPGYGGHTDIQTNSIGGRGLLAPGLNHLEHAPPIDQRFAGGMDLNYAHNSGSSVPYVRGFIKAPLSARSGVGGVTVGAFVDYNFEV